MASLFRTATTHLMQLPDEILLEILKLISPEDLSTVKMVCWRLRSLVLNFTVRLDHTAYTKDAAIKSVADFADLILHCPRLKVLSLIQPVGQSQFGQPVDFMQSYLRTAKQRTGFAKSMSTACPAIRVFEISSLSALRLVRDYVRRLKQKALVTEIRLYSCNSKHVRNLMTTISQCCPSLRVFKFLRRDKADPLPAGDQSYVPLWDMLSHKLHGFSTNVTDRAIIGPALTQLVALRRLVVWYLSAEEIDVLTRSCTQLTSLILMSADAAGFKFLTRQPHLTDLTFCLQRDDAIEMSVFEADFDAVFREIGPRLRRISFDFRKCSSAGCLKNLTLCTQLSELKLRGFADKVIVFKLIQEVKSLRSVTWKEEDVSALVTDVLTPHMIQKMFKNCPLLQKFVLNDTQYSRRTPAATRLQSE